MMVELSALASSDTRPAAVTLDELTDANNSTLPSVPPKTKPRVRRKKEKAEVGARITPCLGAGIAPGWTWPVERVQFRVVAG